MPESDHVAISPAEDAIDRALASNADVLAGFSLGAHLLLGIADGRPRILLAPFPDLKAEARLGGSVETVRIRKLQRMLQRDAQAAVDDFHRRIGVEPPPSDPDHETLAWGLQRMLQPGSAPVNLPTGSICVAGEHDPLLDISLLAIAMPLMQIVSAGHHPQPLLEAAARLRQVTAE